MYILMYVNRWVDQATDHYNQNVDVNKKEAYNSLTFNNINLSR